ncbi:MAG: hypothetical protein HQK53_17190 [Oligoflexia bacterium]|nr:hypothetical protein [Oligoflexia bacterium]
MILLAFNIVAIFVLNGVNAETFIITFFPAIFLIGLMGTLKNYPIRQIVSILTIVFVLYLITILEIKLIFCFPLILIVSYVLGNFLESPEISKKYHTEALIIILLCIVSFYKYLTYAPAPHAFTEFFIAIGVPILGIVIAKLFPNGFSWRKNG